MSRPGYTRVMSDPKKRCLICGTARVDLRRIYIRAPRAEGHGFRPAGWVCPPHLGMPSERPEDGPDLVGPDTVGIPEEYNPPIE
ncbi:unnamed protein product [marine sediment metagenome]|uniref:Uncharacterized protein n=1 Tax=marine sediment metagenome TaxID=412755 RepID=X1DLJ9_9ZZZZ